MATCRQADLLERVHEVHRINTSPPEKEWVAAEVRFRVNRLWHYLRQRRHIREALRSVPEAPVLWNSISPARLGHWHDLFTVFPAIAPQHPILQSYTGLASTTFFIHR